MHQIFEFCDKYNDLVLPRQKFIKKLRDDVRIVKILEKPAVYITTVDRALTLDRLLT